MPKKAIVKNAPSSVGRPTIIIADLLLGCEMSSNTSLISTPLFFVPVERVFIVPLMRETIGSARWEPLTWHTSRAAFQVSSIDRNEIRKTIVIYFPSVIERRVNRCVSGDADVENIEAQLIANAACATVFAGIRNDTTSYQGLVRLHEIVSEPYTVDTGSRTVIFHPKLYLVRGRDCARLVIGSANLTLAKVTLALRSASAAALIGFPLGGARRAPDRTTGRYGRRGIASRKRSQVSRGCRQHICQPLWCRVSILVFAIVLRRHG
jgi:hypothetical protein